MAKFIKDFNYSVELFKNRTRYNNTNMKYGIIGEERVAYQLKICQANILCLHNIRLIINERKMQFDFVVITDNNVYVLEVKNLMGNLILNQDNSVERLIYKKTGIERYGIENPVIGIKEQEKELQKYIARIGINTQVNGMLIMGNDKTIIYNYSNFKNVFKYEKINEFFEKECINAVVSDISYTIANQLLHDNKEYDYRLIELIKYKMYNQYIPCFNNKEDEMFYMKLLGIRKKYCDILKMPACNIYNNKEAELLVKYKPKNKEEFTKIRGFKEKRYQLLGGRYNKNI